MAIGDRGSIDLAVGAIAISGGIHINVSMSRDNFVRSRHRRVWGMVGMISADRASGDRGSNDLAVGAIAISGSFLINVSRSRDNFVKSPHRRVEMIPGVSNGSIGNGRRIEPVIFAIPGDYFEQN